MRKLFSIAIMAVIFMTSCQEKKVEVNGEKVALEDGLYAYFQTTNGEILVKLEHEKAPMTVANFASLAEGTNTQVSEEYMGKPFFDGLKFHRVIPEFMIQGGDPDGNGSGGPGYSFEDEFDESLKHDGPGILSMANSGPSTNGSQFFITIKATPWLDGKHSIFGRVVAGQENVDAISLVERDNRDMPKEDVLIEKLTIYRVGSDLKNYDPVVAFEEGKKASEEKAKMAEEEKAKAQAAFLNSLKESNPDIQESSTGLLYVINDVGSGPKPEVGKQVMVDYAGFLPDGTCFDASIKEIAQANGIYDERREPYGPFPVVYGPQSQVIQGWREGLQLLNVGGSAKLFIPPHLGYGERGFPGVIPPNSWLIFDVMITDIVSEEK